MIYGLFWLFAGVLFSTAVNAQIGDQLPASRILDVTVVANAPPGGAGDKLWKMFDDAVTEKSDERIALSMLVHGEIGGDDQFIQAIRRGRAQVGVVGDSGFAQVVPEVAVLNMPYLFDGPEELDFVVDQYVTPAIKELTAARNLEFLQWVEIGWMNLYAKAPLLSPDDTTNYRLRALRNETSRAFLTAIGVDVINLSFPDVIPGLQTGLIDGGESSTLMYALAGLYQEAPHLSLTRHAYSFAGLLADKAWLYNLEPAGYAVMTTSFPDQAFVRRNTRESLTVELETVEQEGVIVHRFDVAAIEPWAARARATHQDLLSRIGGDAQRIYDLVQDGKAAFEDRAEEAAKGGE